MSTERIERQPAPTDERPEALGVRSAKKSFGRRRALDDVSLQLARGEWVALLGPNGAGKTTLVRACAGLTPLDAGSIAVSGKVLARRGAAARGLVGLVPQEIALYPLLTPIENLRAFGELHGVRGAELDDRIRWALEWTGLSERRREPVHRLSGGMKRRLNIACGVLHRPAVVLLDEPTVGVDPQGRQRIWDMLEELRLDGAALLQSTHQLDEVQYVCDRVVVIDHGHVLAEGTLDELVARTFGPDRRLRITLDGPAGRGALPPGFEAEGPTVRGTARDVVRELPEILAGFERQGFVVHDVHVTTPTLEDVFTQLTGRDLRE